MDKLFIASDHAGFVLKDHLIDYLKEDFEIVDLGVHINESTDYPIYGKKLAEAIIENKGIGIAICGSGIGISISVNRFKGVRGALCRSVEDAKMSRLHNNSNVLCLGARSNTIQEINDIVDTWLNTSFEGGRHERRVELLDS